MVLLNRTAIGVALFSISLYNCTLTIKDLSMCFFCLQFAVKNVGQDEVEVVFSNYLSNWFHLILHGGQGLIRLLYSLCFKFTVYVNNMGQNVSNATFHFYDNDAAAYCAPSLAQVAEYLQNAFVVLQITLHELNPNKSKLMLFTSKGVRH